MAAASERTQREAGRGGKIKAKRKYDYYISRARRRQYFLLVVYSIREYTRTKRYKFSARCLFRHPEDIIFRVPNMKGFPTGSDLWASLYRTRSSTVALYVLIFTTKIRTFLTRYTRAVGKNSELRKEKKKWVVG